MIRSSDIYAAHPGLNSSWIVRWRDAGYIEPTSTARRGAWIWPDWTLRMVALLVMENERCATRTPTGNSRAGLFRAVASWLAATPADPVQCVVRVDDRDPLPAWTAAQVAALCAGVQVHAEIVAIPA